MFTPESMIGLLRNEIERKNAELEKTRQQLLNAQKMEALGVLAGGIAHDFNNILAAIMGNAELALASSDKEEISRFLSEIILASKKGADLIEQIRTFSRNGANGKKQLIKIAPLIENILKLLKSSLPKKIKIEKKLEFIGPTLADQSQIHQIFTNLCINAFHAMEEKGGILTISLTEKGHEDEGKNYICLEVKDTGNGIPPEIQEKIFDPYFTTKSEAKGTGLGLSIVQGIVLAMEGKVKVESEFGKGTTFSVFLPLAETTEGGTLQ